MKIFTKILALILAVMMLAAAMVACGDKKDDSKKDDTKTDSASQTEGGDSGNTADGEEQTWGEITVFVPADMELNGGDLADKENKKAVRLLAKDDAMKYINITVYDDDSSPKSNLDMTKSMNEEYNPADVEYETNGGKWTGLEYDSYGLHCMSMYAPVGDKVYYVMCAGYDLKDNNGNLPAVLASLK